MPFINEVVANTTRYAGIQVDIEPSWTNPEEIHGYINFVNLLSREMHKRGKKVVLAVASWVKAFADFKLLGTCEADKICTMDTVLYVQFPPIEFLTLDASSHTDAWDRAFFKIVNSMPLEKVCIGIMSTDPNTGKFLTEEEIAHRFELIKKYNVDYVALWKAPIPENMKKFVRDFLYN
ncbi:hypothetical protein GEMRC1_006073 [Eukaryota sp. GEM-RC1]